MRKTKSGNKVGGGVGREQGHNTLLDMLRGQGGHGLLAGADEGQGKCRQKDVAQLINHLNSL